MDGPLVAPHPARTRRPPRLSGRRCRGLPASSLLQPHCPGPVALRTGPDGPRGRCRPALGPQMLGNRSGMPCSGSTEVPASPRRGVGPAYHRPAEPRCTTHTREDGAGSLRCSRVPRPAAAGAPAGRVHDHRRRPLYMGGRGGRDGAGPGTGRGGRALRRAGRRRRSPGAAAVTTGRLRSSLVYTGTASPSAGSVVRREGTREAVLLRRGTCSAAVPSPERACPSCAWRAAVMLPAPWSGRISRRGTPRATPLGDSESPPRSAQRRPSASCGLPHERHRHQDEHEQVHPGASGLGPEIRRRAEGIRWPSGPATGGSTERFGALARPAGRLAPASRAGRWPGRAPGAAQGGPGHRMDRVGPRRPHGGSKWSAGEATPAVKGPVGPCTSRLGWMTL